MNSKCSSYAKWYNKTEQDGFLNTPPIYLDFRFGNLCNFKCRTCGSYASSSWAKEEKYLGKLHQDAPNHYDHWTYNIKFWQDIENIKKYIKIMYFAGGEPFVQEGHYKMLQFLVNSGYSKNIELSYNTNLSYSGNFKGYDLEELWKSFKSIELWHSIDGFTEQAEYGSKGLDIELFKKNSIKFSKYITTFSIVSSIYSITSNIELIKWIKSLDKSFSITNLTSPSYQSTTVLSKRGKNTILKKYKKDLLNITNLTDYELNTILDSLRHMSSREDSTLATEFKKQNQQSDLFRNESFEAVYPELAEWYKNI